eukprot:6196522-Pleurochrysis_carterae.AAC.3
MPRKVTDNTFLLKLKLPFDRATTCSCSCVMLSRKVEIPANTADGCKAHDVYRRAQTICTFAEVRSMQALPLQPRGSLWPCRRDTA